MTILKYYIVFLFVVAQTSAFAQNDTDAFVEEIEHFQEQLNEKYKNPETSPLSSKDIDRFTGHNYFDVDESYKVEARFEKIEEPVSFLMKTSTSRLPEYNTFGFVHFTLKGKQFKLNVYKSLSSYDDPDYADYLFLPFTDLTNGEESYAVGRYIDLRIPKGDTIFLDFNKSYNPYCAYSKSYSCPIPPAENNLNIRVEAGIKNNPLK